MTYQIFDTVARTIVGRNLKLSEATTFVKTNSRYIMFPMGARI